MNAQESRQSSIVVAVRVRPFTNDESIHLIRDNYDSVLYPTLTDSTLTLPGSRENNNNGKSNKWKSVRASTANRPNGIRKVVDCVDDKMLIFDPADTNPLNRLSETVLNTMYSRRQASRRHLRLNGGELKFMFDRLFDEEADQMSVYQATTSPLLDSVLDGYNGTVFAYGATGCGKTFTVSGTPEQPGVIFLVMEELFQKIENLRDTKNIELTLSYLEIYNESIRDLLNPSTSSKRLVIREDSENKITVANLSHHRPTTVQEVMDLVIKGNINRTTSATDANETSSRSHAVLQIHVSQTNRTADLTSDHTFATLSIIDLAGSERAAATKNRGERLYEGANINKSLLALGNCINALCMSDGTRRSCHVPYRDSKLTRLLKFSLGGNCKTVMIVCISPSSSHYDETLNTLKYANRAKEIKTKVIRNQQSLDRHVGSYLKMITEQKKEIDELRQREQNMIELQMKKYKLGREKIQLAIEDCVRNIQNRYAQTNKFQHAKNIKSLILCKRRYLQMVKIEIDDVISVVEDWTDLAVISSCTILKDQLNNKIRELEEQFDTPDELDLVIEHAKTADHAKLSEMEFWDKEFDGTTLEIRLDYISELVRNEVLVNASMLTEKLFDSPSLMKKCKFLSQCLASKHNIQNSLEGLLEIDKEFEKFGKNMFVNDSEINFTMKLINLNKITHSDTNENIDNISIQDDIPLTTIRVKDVTTTNIMNNPEINARLASSIPDKRLVKPLRVAKNNESVSINNNSTSSPNNSPSPKNLHKVLNPIIASKKINWINNDHISNTSMSDTGNTSILTINKRTNRKQSRVSLDADTTDIDVSMQDIYPSLPKIPSEKE